MNEGFTNKENVFQPQGKRGLLNGSSSASKRPALSSITNCSQTTRDNYTQMRFHKQEQGISHLDSLLCVPSSMQSFTLTSLLSVPSLVGHSSSNCTFDNTSFTLSTSITSPGSPMLVSSPDISIVDINCCDENYGEYTLEVYSNLRHSEVLNVPNPGFIHHQPDITANMRSILIDWLVEVVDEFQLSPQTLFLAVAYTDRYLSQVSIPRAKLQLVGTTCLYLASKFEEIYPPEIGEFAYITDDTYNKKQIVKMEQHILKVNKFLLVIPTIYTFLVHFLEISSADVNADVREKLDKFSKYLSELALIDIDPFSKYLPSVIAASAVCLARHTLCQPAWSTVLQYHSGYNVSDISQCLQDMHRTHALAHCHTQQAVHQKYLNNKYLKIALLKSPETLPC